MAVADATTVFSRGVSDLVCGRGRDRDRGQNSWSLTPRLLSLLAACQSDRSGRHRPPPDETSR